MLLRGILIGWLTLMPLGVGAVPPPGRNQAVAVLNEYVRYCNETIHGLWMLHEAWRELNSSANSTLTYGRGSLYFRNDDPLGKIDYYETLPADIYQRCLADSKVLGPAQPGLNTRLTALKTVLDQLYALNAEASIYVTQKQQAQDPGLRRLFGMLERAEKLFDDYDQAKERLFAEVQRVYEAQYRPPNLQHRIVASAQAMLPAIVVCKNLLDDLDRNDSGRVATYLNELNAHIARLEAQKTANLAGVYRFGPSNGLDAGYRYDRVVSSLKALADHGKSFQTSNWRPYNDRNRLKTEFYYNERFLNKYNRYGLGLIGNYNAFVELADGKKIQQQAEIPDYYIKNKSIKLDVTVTVLLQWAEEPHQFRVVYPAPEKPGRTDQPPKTEKPTKPEKKEPVPTATAGGDTAPAKAGGITGETLEGYAENHLIFLLDVSGSMNRPDKLPLLQDAFKYLLTLTRREDKVAIVSYSGEAQVELKSVSAAKRKKIEARLEKLETHGGTNANRGLKLAYEVANASFIPAGNNRIILASDGEFSINEATEALIAESLRRGIALTVFFFGEPKSDKVTQQLQRLASLGKGNFRQITAENARQALLAEAQAVRKR